MTYSPLIETVAYVIMNVICGLFTITGNAIILLAVYKTPGLRTPSNYFIASLAASDLIVGIFINTINSVIGATSLGKHDIRVLQQLEQFFYVQTIVASTSNLCAVSIDRYIAITKPLRYNVIMTDQTCFRIIMFIWSMSILCR